MAVPKYPTGVRFDEKSNAFAFGAEIHGRPVQCLMEVPAAEYLYGTKSTQKERVLAISGNTILFEIAEKLVMQDATEPLRIDRTLATLWTDLTLP